MSVVVVLSFAQKMSVRILLFVTAATYIFLFLELGTVVLDTHNPNPLILISTVGTFNLRI